MSEHPDKLWEGSQKREREGGTPGQTAWTFPLDLDVSFFVPGWSLEPEEFHNVSFSPPSARPDPRMMLKKVRFQVRRRNFLLRFA